jgi:hypothetical protein
LWRRQTLKITRDQAVSIAVFTAVAYNGLFLPANGIFMLAAPAVWYVLVPGVANTGFYKEPSVEVSSLVATFDSKDGGGLSSSASSETAPDALAADIDVLDHHGFGALGLASGDGLNDDDMVVL